MAKNPAFLLKMIDNDNINCVVQALTAVIDAAAFYSVDRQRWEALTQNRQASDDDDGKISAPAAAIYQSHSYDIVDMHTDSLGKAQAEADDTRRAEMNLNSDEFTTAQA